MNRDRHAVYTTIRGGLPVKASGRFVPGFRGTCLDPPEPPGFEDIEVAFEDGRPFPHELSDEDLEAVEVALFDSYETPEQRR